LFKHFYGIDGVRRFYVSRCAFSADNDIAGYFELTPAARCCQIVTDDTPKAFLDHPPVMHDYREPSELK